MLDAREGRKPIHFIKTGSILIDVVRPHKINLIIYFMRPNQINHYIIF